MADFAADGAALHAARIRGAPIPDLIKDGFAHVTKLSSKTSSIAGPAYALSLTSREAEVLLWLSRGKSNRDIAEILGLSPRTVNKHLEQMFEKLGVENRASATALAIRTLEA